MGAGHRAVGQHQLLGGLVPLRLPRLIAQPGVTLPARLQRGLLAGDIGAQTLQRAPGTTRNVMTVTPWVVGSEPDARYRQAIQLQPG
jgi:hypothetical protein